MSEGTNQSLFSRTPLLGGAVGGLLHAGIAIALWDYVSGNSLWYFLETKPLLGIYLVLGVVVPGVVPAVLYVGKKRTFPTFVVALVLVIAIFGSWRTGPPDPPFAGPTLLALYVFLWVPTVALAILVGLFEPDSKQGTRD